MALKKYEHITDVLEAKESDKNIKNYINDYSDDINIVFLELCKSGKKKLAKWILKTYQDFNPYFEEGIVLSWACLNGDFEMLKWLYNLKKK